MSHHFSKLAGIILAVVLAGAILLSSAGCSKTNESGAAAKAVENYYTALAGQKRDQISSLVCKDWEKDALTEVDSFMGVKSEMKDMKCTAVKADETTSTVTCTGKISASYGTEITDFPLERYEFTVVKQNGDWLLCGKKQKQ